MPFSSCPEGSKQSLYGIDSVTSCVGHASASSFPSQICRPFLHHGSGAQYTYLNKVHRGRGVGNIELIVIASRHRLYFYLDGND